MKFFSYVKLLGFILIWLAAKPASAQDHSRLRISLFTCTPGEELYSIFGHSALRIIDSNSVSDIVYNYGTFNFNDEGFYLKFIQGKLRYYISIENTNDFIANYQAEGRGITEQVLALTEMEKKKIQVALYENLKEENKYYAYDFFLDNCTTRLRDLIVANKSPKPILPAVMPLQTSYRNAIHEYLSNGQQYWSMLGIDLLLGKPTDQLMTASQQQFLPDNLMRSLDSSSNTVIVAHKSNLYATSSFSQQGNWLTPLRFFSLLLLLVFLLSLSKKEFSRTLLQGFDGLVFFLTGLLGIVLIFMWIATDHSMTKVNMNLIWAWPTHFFVSFFMGQKKQWVKKYLLLYAAIMCVVLLTWFFLPQKMNNALIPFVLMLAYRAYQRGMAL